MVYISTRSISNKSQVWSIDFAIAIFIFLGALLFFYIYSINLNDIGAKPIENLIRNAEIVSDNLVSPGVPANWTISDVSIIGIIGEEQRLDTDKLDYFNTFASSNYTLSKRFLSTRNNYHIFFEDRNSARIRINGIDYIGRDYSLDNPKDIIKVYRFVVYNSTIIRMGVYLW